MKLARKIWLIILTIAISPVLSGWGYEGHRRINYIASFQLKNKFDDPLVELSGNICFGIFGAPFY